MKILTGLSLGLFAFSSWAYVNVQNVDSGLIYDLSVDSISLSEKQIEGHTFQTATLNGVDGFTGIHYQVGAPELPVLRFEVSANSAQDITITERHLKSDVAVKATNLKPVFESVEKVPNARYEFTKGMALANVEGSSIKEIGSSRGMKRFLVTLYPVQYSQGTLSVARSYSVEVKSQKTAKSKAPQGIVFIVGKKFKESPSLAAYVSLKMSQGFEVDQINASAKTKASTIRKKLQALYKKKPQLAYAIIIGDAEDVPGKDSDTISGTTDHFYASLDADYEKDIFTPELQVGRFSVSSEEQLAVVIAKYTRYIKGDFRTMSWLSHMAFLATDDRFEVAEGTHNYVVDTYTKEKGYTGSFPKANQPGGDKLYAITNKAETSDVLKSLLKGRSIVDYSGHGAETYWAGPHFDQADVRSLTYSSLPFVISNACITGNFKIDESFAETWQRHEWGAIVFWGSMDSTYWDEDDILERRMFDGIFKEGKTSFGDITQYALEEFVKFYNGEGRSAYYLETYHVFGDPSINIRI